MSITTVRLKRFTAHLRELKVGECMTLAKMAPERDHVSTSTLLKYIVDDASGLVTDPLEWTVEERLMVKAMYMSGTLEDGPDFSVGDDAKFTDYAMGDKDYIADSVDVDGFSVINMTGRLAESIERLEGEIEVSEYGHWLMGSIAARLHSGVVNIPDNDSDLDAWAFERIKELLSLDQSEFSKRCMILATGNEKINHLFNLTIAQAGGYAVAPREEESELPLARFPVDAVIQGVTKAMGGKS